MLSKEDRVLIKMLTAEKGYGAKRLMVDFRDETGLLML